MFLIDLFEVSRLLGQERGAANGTAAASWVFDGNTNEATYEHFLSGILEGDPEVLDKLPHADLSGEWADRYSMHSLEVDLGFVLSNELDTIPEESIADFQLLLDEAATAYEDAFGSAVESKVQEVCLYQLEGRG